MLAITFSSSEQQISRCTISPSGPIRKLEGKLVILLATTKSFILSDSICGHSWVKDEKDWKVNTLNARNDELFTKASYKNYWPNRCLVLCTGSFEPHYPKGSKDYESWYIKPAQGGMFMLGAIYAPWNGMNTVSIITTDATPLMSEVHNDGKRQPLILDGDATLAWLVPDLSKTEMRDLMYYEYSDDKLNAYRTMDGIYNAKLNTDVPAATKPYEKSKSDVLWLFDLG